LGGRYFDFWLELGVATGVAIVFMETVGEVTVASVVEITVKEPKQISAGLARMSAMLARKTTPDRATMLHSEFPISPTWRQLSGGKTWQIHKGATQAVVG
jgi:hypothetical protein